MSETTPDCRTCLYMATHEKCDDCLDTEEDRAKRRNSPPTREPAPFRYLHYREGNWMDRVLQAEIDGHRSIVIGGQGEAEVNTKATPHEAAKNLHYVAEQCGYMVSRLSRDRAGEWTLVISTHDGNFRLIWDKSDKLQKIENLEEKNGWSWENRNPWRECA